MTFIRYQAQVNEYKFEIERLQRELQEVKKRYYEQKRREHLTQGDEVADSKGFKLQQPSAGSRCLTSAHLPHQLRSRSSVHAQCSQSHVQQIHWRRLQLRRRVMAPAPSHLVRAMMGCGIEK